MAGNCTGRTTSTGLASTSLHNSIQLSDFQQPELCCTCHTWVGFIRMRLVSVATLSRSLVTRSGLAAPGSNWKLISMFSGLAHTHTVAHLRPPISRGSELANCDEGRTRDKLLNRWRWRARAHGRGAKVTGIRKLSGSCDPKQVPHYEFRPSRRSVRCCLVGGLV